MPSGLSQERSDLAVIGARGFIGRKLVEHLRARGHEVEAIDRYDAAQGRSLGHLIDCGGLTADFRTRKAEMFYAHAGRIDAILRKTRLSSYLYLSSTRVYKSGADTSEEDPLEVRPSLFDDSYNISKIAGEAIALMQDNPSVRVARLSNVVGDNLDAPVFLNSIVVDAAGAGRIVLGESLASTKDYIHIDDVCRYLEAIALKGRHRLYNVAYGENRTHADVLACLSRHIVFEATAPESPVRAFSPINTQRLLSEFGPPEVTPEQAIEQMAVAAISVCVGATGRQDIT